MKLLRFTARACALLTAVAVYHGAQAQLLNGRVASSEEGAMEGVLVSAKKNGSNMTITVVSDAKGNYRFPASKLEPGQYRISIRAIGYDLDGRATADVAAQKTATADLKLRKTADLAAQMTNAEWLTSMPGDVKMKNTLLGCVGCHSLERIVRSKYDSDGFLATVQRMSTYANQTTPLNPQKRLTTRDTEAVGEDRVRVQRTQADFLAGINLYTRDGNVSAQQEGALTTSAAAQHTSGRSVWPLVTAVGAAGVVVGTVSHPVVFKVAVVVLLADSACCARYCCKKAESKAAVMSWLVVELALSLSASLSLAWPPGAPPCGGGPGGGGCMAFAASALSCELMLPSPLLSSAENNWSMLSLLTVVEPVVESLVELDAALSASVSSDLVIEPSLSLSAFASSDCRPPD